ncbi:MAG: hypothetical protein CO108_15460 [Deltaproteobacteria bacterium CG_4_9_14_3_um_filter_63_12]|nr:MAG: hypothetical protein CO108_15460 [Deltaproteobacteria bacterium CG_4_9_14_3_um_filter_63_12]
MITSAPQVGARSVSAARVAAGCALILLLLVGCDDSPATTPLPDTGAANDTSDGVDAVDLVEDVPAELPVDSDVAVDEGTDVVEFTWAELAASYGTIETIAGTGLIPDKDFNGWNPAAEGGSALAAELSRPHIAVADDAGNVYIADKDAHAIRRLDTDQTIHTIAGLNLAGDDGDVPGPATQRHLSSPNGLWAKPDGTLYIFDLGNDKVRKLTPDGTLSTLFRVGGSDTGRGLWVADDESVAYVACGSQLKRWTPSGGVTVFANGFVSLGNLYPSDDHTLLATDRLAHQVFAIDLTTGAKRLIAGNGTPGGGGEGFLATEAGLEEVRGVWAHPRGGFFLATHKGGQVWYVDTAGRIHLFVDGDSKNTHAGDGGPYNAPGPKIAEPRAVTMDRAGNVLITENDGGFIRRVNLR